MTDQEAGEQLCALVAPWLPDAEIDVLSVSDDCGCYSEWTTDPPYFYVTFRATHDHEEKLARLVSALEPIVLQWVMQNYEFSGCSGCQGEDYRPGEPAEPSLWVRVIRKTPAQVGGARPGAA